MFSSMMQRSVAGMAGRWLESVAATLTSGTGVMVMVGAVAGLYLVRQVSKKLADKIGIGLGPLIALGLLVGVLFGVGGGSHRLNALLPTSLTKGKAVNAAAAARSKQALRQSNANASAQMDRMWAAEMNGGGTAVPMSPSGFAPGIPGIPRPSFHHLQMTPHAKPGTSTVTSQHAAMASGGTAFGAGFGQVTPFSVSAASSYPFGSPATAAKPGDNQDADGGSASSKTASSDHSAKTSDDATKAASHKPLIPKGKQRGIASDPLPASIAASGKPAAGQVGLRSMADEARHTLEKRRQRQQQQAAGLGFGGGHGSGGGVSPAASAPYPGTASHTSLGLPAHQAGMNQTTPRHAATGGHANSQQHAFQAGYGTPGMGGAGMPDQAAQMQMPGMMPTGGMAMPPHHPAANHHGVGTMPGHATGHR